MVILKVIAKIVLLPVLIAVILFQWIGIFLTGMAGGILNLLAFLFALVAGASYLTGLAVGFWTSKDDVIKNWALDKEFEPAMDDAKRAEELKGWKKAVNATLGWAKD